MSNRTVAAAVAVITLVMATSPAIATNCQSWRRMNENQRWDRVYRMIDDAISGQGGRNYQLNRAAIGRCLERHVDSMYQDFDDVCTTSKSAPGEAIDRIFKSYIWSCVG